MKNNFLNFALFQLGWFGCVLGGAAGKPLLGTALAMAIISWHLWHTPKPEALFALVFVLVGSLLIVSSIALAKCDLARLEIINKTDQPVSISLSADKTFYYLTVPPATTKLFTVEREVYDRTTWACGKSDGGTVNIKTQLGLTFVRCGCGNDAPNSGEPGLEKVHIPDAPSGEMWRYK